MLSETLLPALDRATIPGGYLLVQTRPGHATRLLDRLRSEPSVASVEIVTGAFDVIIEPRTIEEAASIQSELLEASMVLRVLFCAPAYGPVGSK